MKKTTLLTTILLLAAMLISSCGNSTFPTEASDSGSGAVEESQSAGSTSGNSENSTSEPVSASPKAIWIEPTEQLPGESLHVQMRPWGSGELENSDGEKVSYWGYSVENTVGNMLIDILNWEGNQAPGMPPSDGFLLEYSDSIKLTTDYLLDISIFEERSDNSWYRRFPTVSLPGESLYYVENGGDPLTGGKKEVLYENGGEKVTVSVEEENLYNIWIRHSFYYDAEKYDGNENIPDFSDLWLHRINEISITGKTSGTVVVEKREDGWHLSGAEGEVELYPLGDDEYRDLHEDELPIIINASPDEDIHLDKYIPEVKELYK